MPGGSPPRVTVAVATFNRAGQLERLLAALRAQTLDRDQFEVVIVDDASSDATAEVLERELARGELDLRVIPHAENRGRATLARGRVAGGPGAADRVHRRRLRAGARAGSSVGSPPAPSTPARSSRAAPSPTPRRPTGSGRSRGRSACPRTTLPFRPATSSTRARCSSRSAASTSRRSAGSTAGRTPTSPGARSSPARRRSSTSACSSATPSTSSGPSACCGSAPGWTLAAYARHPELRRAHFATPIFWKLTHMWLVRALLGLVLPRRLWPLKVWLALPWAALPLRPRQARGRRPGTGSVLRRLRRRRDVRRRAQQRPLRPADALSGRPRFWWTGELRSIALHGKRNEPRDTARAMSGGGLEEGGDAGERGDRARDS